MKSAATPPEAAKELATHGGGLLLDGVTTLSVKVAETLAKNADWLRLNGLTTLTPEVAEALAKHAGWLDLNGLKTLSVEAAEALWANSRNHLARRFDICPSCGRPTSGEPS